MASPASIGPYRVLHQLGAGVLGPVFRAHDPDTDRLVAIKLFQLDFTPEQGRALAEHLEQLAATWPHHPALVTVLAGGREAHAPYLVSEYVASDSLDARLRRRVAGGFRQLLRVLEQVAAALDAAADAGLAHGGLHPRDILVATTGETRVTGVGIAQAIEAAGGRPPLRRPYAAPEQTGRLGWDYRADIYALGVLATELLAGRRPTGGGAASTLNDLLVQSEGLDPEACRRALAQALAESPGARPRRAADLIAMLRAASIEPAAGDEEPLDLPLRLGAAAATDTPSEPEFRPAEPVVEAPAAVDVESAPGREGVDGPDDATPDEELAAVLAGDESDTPMIVVPTPGAVVEPAWTEPPEREAAPDDRPASVPSEPPAYAAFEAADDAGPAQVEEERLTIVAAEREADPEDEAVYGAAARVSGLARERDPAGPVGPVGREFLNPDPPGRSRPLASLLAMVVVGALVGLVGGYLLWGSGPASREGTSSPTPPGTKGTQEAPLSTQPLVEEPLADEPLALPVVPDTGTSRGSAASATPSARPSPGGTTRSEPSPPATPVGRLVVRSAPTGARVIVDGRARGTTPLTLVDLPLGTYGVRVLHDGFAERSQRVALTRARPNATLTIELPRVTAPRATRPAGAAATAATPSAAPGPTAPGATSRLDVVSRPAGARVVLDGRAVGTTPLTLPGVAAGAHSIRLELDGYRPWTTTVQVQGGTPVRVAASLESGDRR